MRTTIGVAIDIPQPWGGVLRRRRARAGDQQARHTPAHLTLLGPIEVASVAIGAIDGHLTDVARAHAPFTLQLKGTGTFRPVTQVVFVAVAGGLDECARLRQAIGDTDHLGAVQRFPFHPHVTVAQDVDPAHLDAVLVDLADFEAQFAVTGFGLYEQESTGRWRERAQYALGSGGA